MLKNMPETIPQGNMPAKIFLKNELIAIMIHVGMCILCFYVPFLLSQIGTWENYHTILWLIAGIYTIAALYLYYWAGRKFLNDTQMPVLNIFSVSIIFSLLVAATLMSGALSLTHLSGIVNLPFYPLFELIFSIYQVDEFGKYLVYLALTPLPPLTILAGFLAKVRKESFDKNKSQNSARRFR